MAEDMLTDITLDHIPDLSDASVSFQLPSASTDLLLADQTDSFDLLRTADVVEDDDDLTFPPAAPKHFRAPPLTLADLTPRPPRTPRPLPHSRSPTLTRVAPSSAKPFVIQTPLGLGHDTSPGKRKQPPSGVRASAAAAAHSVGRQLNHPFGSAEECLEQLRMEVEKLSQPEVALLEPEAKLEQELELAQGPSHAVQRHPVEPQSPSRIITNTSGSPLASEGNHRPDSLSQPTDHVETSSDKDMKLDPADDNGYSADATNVDQPKLRLQPKSRRNPRTNAVPNSSAHHAGITKQRRPVLPERHVPSKIVSKSKASRVLEADQALPSAVPKPTTPQSLHIDSEEEQLVPPVCTSSGDIDTKPRKTQIIITQTDPGGVAGRLMSFSQKLISSIGLGKQALPERITTCTEETASIAKPPVVTLEVEEGANEVSTQTRTQPPPATAAHLPQVSPSLARQHDVNDEYTPSARLGPLRLSEISPQKKPPSPSPPNILLRPNFPAYSGAVVQDGRQHAMSPTRPAKKRLITTLDADLPQEEGCYARVRKKGKTIPAASDEVKAEAECERGSSKEAVSQGYPRVEGTQKEKKKTSQDHEDEPLSRDETRRTSDSTRQRRGLGPRSSSTNKNKNRDHGKSTLPSARTKYRPKLDSSSGPGPCFGTFQRKGPTLHRFPYLVDGGLRQVHAPAVEDKLRLGGNKRARDEGEEGSKSSNTVRVARCSSASTSTVGSRFSASLRQRREKRRRQGKADDNEPIAARPSSPPWRHRDRNMHPRNQDDVDDAMHDARREQSGPVSPISTEVDLPFSEKKQNSTSLVPQAPQLTKPIGFTFRVDARLEARKMDERERERLALSEPGKPSHQAALVPFHGHASVPSMPSSVPLPSHAPVAVEPFYFWTEQRAKEREKFEEVIRRKEGEMMRLREERRRVEAEKEEREIREMRRRAVPRANEVPEWYAGMPKRVRKRVEEGEE